MSEQLRKSAAILLNHAEHGVGQPFPQWLVDCRRDIEAAGENPSPGNLSAGNELPSSPPLPSNAEGDPTLRADAPRQFAYLNSAEMIAMGQPPADSPEAFSGTSAEHSENSGKDLPKMDRSFPEEREHPLPSSPGIKPLNWKKDDTPGCDGIYFRADTSIGRFEVFEITVNLTVGPRTFRGWKSHWTNADQPAESIEDAKASAQAEYERRIRAALSATTPEASDGN